MFLKTIHKAWNIFNHSEQLLENSIENLVLQVSINREESSIDRRLFSIDWIGIKHPSNQAETPGLFFSSLRSIEQNLWLIEHIEFRIILRKIQNLNFDFFNFMKQYSPNLNIIIITYPCIYLYIQQVCDQPTIGLIRLGGELPNIQPTRKGIRLVGFG